MRFIQISIEGDGCDFKKRKRIWIMAGLFLCIFLILAAVLFTKRKVQISLPWQKLLKCLLMPQRILRRPERMTPVNTGIPVMSMPSAKPVCLKLKAAGEGAF